MTVSLTFCRRSLLTSAVLLIGVALVVAAAVMPQVNVEVLRGATPQKAVTAFWVNIILNLLSALTLFFIAIRSMALSWISKFGLIIVGITVLILGLALADAASAYKSHGPSMQSASILLFICAAVDFLAGLLAGTTAFLFPKKT